MTEAVLQEERLSPFIRVTLRRWIKTYRSINMLVSPFFDLMVRLLVAQAIFRSGIVKLSDWDTALNLARFEYPVSLDGSGDGGGGRGHNRSCRADLVTIRTIDARRCGVDHWAGCFGEQNSGGR